MVFGIAARRFRYQWLTHAKIPRQNLCNFCRDLPGKAHPPLNLPLTHTPTARSVNHGIRPTGIIWSSYAIHTEFRSPFPPEINALTPIRRPDSAHAPKPRQTPPPDRGSGCMAQPRCVFQYDLEDRLLVVTRPADDAQYLAQGRFSRCLRGRRSQWRRRCGSVLRHPALQFAECPGWHCRPARKPKPATLYSG